MTQIPKLLKSRQLHTRLFAALPILLMMVSQPAFPPDTLQRQTMLWGGYFLVIAGVLGRIYCSAFIGGRKNDVIVHAGPFSVVRNPLYVFSFIALVGVGLESGMLFITVMLASAFMFYYPVVVAKEEAFLKNKFGMAYEDYMRDVPRWLPNFQKLKQMWNEPEQAEIMPKFLRKTAMDAAIFFLPLPCYTMIGFLQYHRILPIWLALP